MALYGHCLLLQPPHNRRMDRLQALSNRFYVRPARFYVMCYVMWQRR
jgi:hypothetical protein